MERLFQIQYSSLTQIFAILFINVTTFWSQKHEFFRKYISCQKIRPAELFLQSASLTLLECSEYIVV